MYLIKNTLINTPGCECEEGISYRKIRTVKNIVVLVIQVRISALLFKLCLHDHDYKDQDMKSAA